MLYERESGGWYEASRTVFGAEPKDYEVHGFLAKEYYGLRFSPAVAAAVKENRKNPKRVRRQVRKELRESGLGTKAQQALKLQQEQIKTGRKAVSKENKEAKAIRQFELKQQKKKEKHRGR